KLSTTAQSIDEDGWFHTGDAGYLKDGELFLTERIKDLFKTSNGKYIAPQAIESKLSVDRYIEQAVVIADKRKFVSALIVPNYQLIEQYANERGIAYGSREALCKDMNIRKMIMARINTLQQDLANYEKVKHIILLPAPFSIETGELTNTLKVKRNVVNERYAQQIDELYEQAEKNFSK
ncbi:MAG: AMP-binding protein, partial [Bacteroidaceae bacterium]|nr:AMP-binding protein [Bacteroidaceae bacterium]